MNQKGFSLLEVMIVMVLIGIIGSAAALHTHDLEEVKFKLLARQVESSIRSAQHMAITTGTRYNILCTEKAIYVCPGYQKAVYKLEMSHKVRIPRNITGKEISFNGTMAPAKAGTIELIHEGLAKKASITIRVATGKTTIYFDKL